MPTTLGKKYSVEWRGTPPHMLHEDISVWYRFLDVWGPLFISLYYDCLVGGPFYTEKQLQDPMLKMWRATMSKRVDAIAETKDEVWLIEVSKNPGMRAIGQLQAYRALWLEDPPINMIEKPVMVCEFVDQDLISAAVKYGTVVYVMPAPATP